ncbi:MAG: PAS domain S-box protein, partial [Oscillochloris sp.]|nr:PAS domain S-box protein [Oscillochloris sp.]
YILTCNSAFARLQGRTISEVVSIPILSMYAPEDHAYVGQCMAEADRVGSVRYEASMVRKDGSQYPVQMDVVSVRDQSGTLMYRVATQQDITQRKQAEAAFVESERRFRVLIENAPGAITLIGADGRLIYVSSSTQRVMGYRPEDSLGLDPVGFIHPDDLPELLVVLNDLIQHPGKVTIAYYRFRHQDGSWRWVESTISNLFHEPSVQGIAFNFQDITERKQAETALHQSEEQYRGLMKSLDNVIAIVDAEGYFLYMNDIAAHQLGGSPEDFIGRTMHELFPEPIATRQLAHIQIAIRDDQGLIAESQSAVQGQLRWYRTSIQPIHDDLGQVSAALVNSTDIHDLKTAQHDLLELNRTLEARVQQRTAEVVDLYEHAPIGYHSLDVVGNLIMINQTELKWMGYTREAMLGRPLTDFITPRSQMTFQEYFPILIQRGWLKDIEIDFIRKDGTILPGLVSATAIYDQAGVYVMSRSTVFDNTERKQAEDALRESEAQNRLLFEESPDAVALFDQIGVMLRVNRAFERMMGYPAERLIGTTLDALGLISSEQSALLIPKAIQTVQTYADFSVVSIKITRADGESRHLGVRLFALYIQGHQHVLATMRDITLEKHAEETLRMANAELARAARAKDEFLANMSHELRTPINAILAFSESLQEAIYGLLTDRQREAIDNIEIGGRHLLTLINDILDLAKVEAERLDLQIEPISLESVCHSSLMFVKEQALKKDLLLEFRLNDRLSMLEADGKRLKQMLVNLLSNAVKFTPAGGRVCLDVNIDLDAGMVRFVVQDTGIGIAPDDLSRLFQPFNQIDSGLSRQHEGTGLGLVLVRRLAELHGGSVAVESTVGVGSRFTITLPYRLPTISATVAPLPVLAPPTDIHVEATAPGVVRARVLLAEDNEANLTAIGEYLRVMGCLVFIARNGYEVLARLDEVQPDVILMDIQMPEMDGLETMRRLRAMTEYATIPILVLTALAMPGDRERCMAAGANAYMTKPISLRVLMETIQQLISV